jgi:hypothetical protein
VETFPADNVTDPKAYLTAIKSFLPGDAVTIFTPDDTHFEIALAAIERGEQTGCSSFDPISTAITKAEYSTNFTLKDSCLLPLNA